MKWISLALATALATVPAVAAHGQSLPSVLKLTVKNDLALNPSDTGLGVQGYPRVSLRSGTSACWDPRDIRPLSGGATGPEALANGGAALFRTENFKGLPFIPGPCKPLGVLSLPHYLNYTLVVQESRNAAWEPATASRESKWDQLLWQAAFTPNPASGFIAAIPPTGTLRSTPSRTVCLSATGYPRWPLPYLWTGDALTLTVSAQCPTPPGAPGPVTTPDAPTTETVTRRVVLRAGQTRMVSLGAAGQRWTLSGCTGAQATAPRAGRGAVTTEVGRRSRGSGSCVFRSSTADGDSFVTTVEVRARR
jgi:hypothetical protein